MRTPPHPAFGHLLPAHAGRRAMELALRESVALRPPQREKVALSEVEGPDEGLRNTK